MRKLLVILFILTIAVPVFSQDAKAILDEADKAFELDSVYSRSTLTVYKKDKAQAPQVMEGYMKDAADGSSRSLSVFRDPPRVSGTAYLMLGDDLWVRFASTGRIRKLSSSAKKNSAAGSDFSYADMGDGGQSFTEKYEPSYDGMVKLDGRDCHRLILLPLEKDAPYEKMIVWITADSNQYKKIEYYSKGAAIKYMILDDYRSVGNVDYPYRAEMVSLVKRSRSVMETQLLEYDSPKVEEKLFSTGYLENIR